MHGQQGLVDHGHHVVLEAQDAVVDVQLRQLLLVDAHLLLPLQADEPVLHLLPREVAQLVLERDTGHAWSMTKYCYLGFCDESAFSMPSGNITGSNHYLKKKGLLCMSIMAPIASSLEGGIPTSASLIKNSSWLMKGVFSCPLED